MDMWDRFQRNIEAANKSGSGDMYQNYANAGVVDASAAAPTAARAGIQAGIDEQQRQAAASAAKQRAELEAKRKADEEDPSKAYMKLGDDGRYHFYNGVGKSININDFSLMTGKRPDEILADSENPADQKFVADYNMMRTFASAWVNGDNDTLKRLRASDPDSYNSLVGKYKSPAEMVQGFREYYSDYYGNTQNAQQEAPRLTSSQMNPQFEFKPDKTDVAGQNVAALLGGSDLQKTLSPNNTQNPGDPGFLGNAGYSISKYGPLALFGGGSLWGKSEEQKAWEAYQEKVKNDPWVAYNSYLGR